MSITQPARISWVHWATRFTLTMSLLLTLLTAAPPGARADDPTPTPDVAVPAASVEVAPTAVTVPGLQTPNGLAISPYDNWIYVTSRDNDRVLKLDGTTYAVLASAAVGDQPWGLVLHGEKLYVANFGSGTVSVLRRDTLETLKTIAVGANSQPTFVQSMWFAQRIVVALHGLSQIAVIDAKTDQVDLRVSPEGTGAWGLTAETRGTRVFAGFRESAGVVMLNSVRGWEMQTPPGVLSPCGAPPQAAVYGLTFDTSAGKLYVACARYGSVDSVVIYQVAAGGAFTRGATLSLPPGGSDGGGGLAYNPGSRNVFVTNSASGSTSVISGVTDRVVRTLPTGRDPFGVAVDDVRNLVYVGDRAGNRLYVFPDEGIPYLQVANGLASDPLYSHLYVTSRSNNTLLRLDAATLGYQARAAAGNLPWGVAVNPLTRRVYAGSFGTGELYVYDADTLAQKAVVAVGPEPTFVDTNTVTNKVLLVSHAADQLVVLNGATNAVETTRATGGVGAWGLAVNPKLNYAYVAHRKTGGLVTLDGNSGWTPRQTITACAGGGSPYALAFNPVNDKLYLACANSNDVNTAVIFQASATDLVRQVQLAIGHGGDDGGGGIAVDTATGNVLFTNTTDGTATIIDAGNTVRATRALGLDPFGAAASPVLRRFWAGLRMGNNVVAVPDSWGIGYTAPTLTVTPGNACYGVSVTIKGTGFPYNAAQSWGRQIELRLGTQYLQTVDLSPNGTFVTSLTLTSALMPGGTANVLAFPVGLPGILAVAPVRVPRTDVPVILTHGVAGGTFQMQEAITYTAEPDAGHPKAKDFTYAQYSTPWLSTDAISTALWGDDRYFDVLRLTVDQQPLPDRYGRTPSIRPLDPIWYLQAPVSGEITDVYGGLYNYLARFKVPGKTLFGWAYDWRKDMSATEQELDKKIHEAMAAAGTDKVSLVVHSMGGLVVRNYILKYGTEHIDQLITFGTPYLGSVMIAKYLEIGDNMGMKLFGWSLDPREVTKMSQDFGSTYTLLPSREYFLPSPWDTGSYEGRYIYLELISDPKDPKPSNVYQMLDYDKSLQFLIDRGHRASLMAQGQQTRDRGMGDLRLYTDQYYNQRIAGAGNPTIGVLRYQRIRIFTRGRAKRAPRFVGYGEGYGVPVPVLNLWGDDTVPLRSAVGYFPGETWEMSRYYPVYPTEKPKTKTEHMTLGANPNVQALIGRMLQGNLCFTSQLATSQATDAPLTGPVSTGPAVEATAGAGMATATQLTLLGAADLSITDAEGNHLGPVPGRPGAYENNIDTAGHSVSPYAQVAALTASGTYTVTLHGAEPDGGAVLQIAEMQEGVSGRTLVYSGLPITSTTTATLTLTLPALPADLPLTLQYEPMEPAETLTPVELLGSAAVDVTAPTVRLHWDPVTHLVTVEALDEDGGSGLDQVVTATGNPAGDYRAYTGPFIRPAGAGCVHAYVTDRAGNGATDSTCLTWLPLLMR